MKLLANDAARLDKARRLAVARIESEPPAPATAPTPLRAQILQEGLALTMGERNRSYGDPLPNFNCTATLKAVFWAGMQRSGKRIQQNSPFGHSIDMILTNLARVATGPTTHLERDRYRDISNYSAIAYEVGVLSEPSAELVKRGEG